jgi:hypothetical protein
MTNSERIAIPIIGVLFLTVLMSVLVNAEEPTQPRVDRNFDSKREATIAELKSLPLDEAFDRLTAVENLANEDFSNKAAFVAFKDRKEEAVVYASHELTTSRQVVEGESIYPHYGFDVAKRIFRIFPDDGLGVLSELYYSGDAITKGNVIVVLGKMAAGLSVRNMLIEALDDKTFCEEEDPEMVGKPIRICDEAYNQLVLRYSIKNVLRTIGNAHRIEVRDYHIDVLKGLL